MQDKVGYLNKIIKEFEGKHELSEIILLGKKNGIRRIIFEEHKVIK